MPSPKKSVASSVRKAFGTPESQQEGPSFLDRLMAGLKGEDSLGGRVAAAIKRKKKRPEDDVGY